VYLRLLRLPGVGRLVAAALVARVPISMVVTANVLLVQRATGSFATAGAVDAAYALAAGVGAPLIGRLVDRLGQSRVLVPAAAGYAAGMTGLVAAALAGAPAPVLCVPAALAGALIPPISACMRALWPDLVHDSTVPVATAFAFESVMVEAFFILGPLVAGALVALASPAAAMLTAAALSLTGTLLFATTPRSRGWRPEPAAQRSWAGALSAPGIRALVAATVPFGAAFGVLGVALPAFAVHHGAAAATGPLWAAQAAGSAAGGLLYGVRAWRRPLDRRYVELLALFTLGLAPLAAAGSLGVLLVLIAVGGMALAPATAAGFQLVDRLAPPGTRTEAFTWVITATVAGSALGAAGAGVLVQGAGAAAGLLAACGCGVVSVLVGAAGRPRLAARAGIA
jgi:MFS family permease